MQTTDHAATPTTRSVWMRGLFMVIFIILFGVGQVLMNLSALVQFLWLLFTGEPNRIVVRFGKSLSIWLSEVALFLTCGSDEKPFPWREWPTIV